MLHVSFDFALQAQNTPRADYPASFSLENQCAFLDSKFANVHDRF